MTGTRAEGRFNDAIIARPGVTEVHNVADELSVRTLLPLLERAHSMISVDTGPAHAAAALGCPTVALFGTAESDSVPSGWRHHARSGAHRLVDGGRDILGITPEAVIAALVRARFVVPKRRPRILLSR